MVGGDVSAVEPGLVGSGHEQGGYGRLAVKNEGLLLHLSWCVT
jgi:hypothetical protein